MKTTITTRQGITTVTVEAQDQANRVFIDDDEDMGPLPLIEFPVYNGPPSSEATSLTTVGEEPSEDCPLSIVEEVIEDIIEDPPVINLQPENEPEPEPIPWTWMEHQDPERPILLNTVGSISFYEINVRIGFWQPVHARFVIRVPKDIDICFWQI